jgi:hypothetical protein
MSGCEFGSVKTGVTGYPVAIRVYTVILTEFRFLIGIGRLQLVEGLQKRHVSSVDLLDVEPWRTATFRVLLISFY